MRQTRANAHSNGNCKYPKQGKHSAVPNASGISASLLSADMSVSTRRSGETESVINVDLVIQTHALTIQVRLQGVIVFGVMSGHSPLLLG